MGGKGHEREREGEWEGRDMKERGKGHEREREGIRI